MTEKSVYEIINAKSKGNELSRDEISCVVNGYLEGKVTDAQIGAFLMAVMQRNLNEEEICHLTDVMSKIGERLDLKDLSVPKIDKHSTGGVGDGVSLSLIPIAASLGLAVPSMAGRSLGFTGGTIDKLESIPGMRTELSPQEIKNQMRNIGCAVFSQSGRIAAADSKLYAVRDQIACVESEGLIISSILSKKLIEDIDGLVLDVKVGSGALIPDYESAIRFSITFRKIAKRLGLKTTIFVTDMDQPLGKNIGNSLEVEQAVEILSGRQDDLTSDIRYIIMELAAEMLVIGGLSDNVRAAREKVEEALTSGRALNKFRELVKSQGGDDAIADDPGKLPRAKNKLEVLSRVKGYVKKVDSRYVARCLALLGGTRNGPSGNIDLSTGIVLNKKYGDFISEDEPLGYIIHNYAPDEMVLSQAEEALFSAYSISSSRVKEINLVKEIINNG